MKNVTLNTDPGENMVSLTRSRIVLTIYGHIFVIFKSLYRKNCPNTPFEEVEKSLSHLKTAHTFSGRFQIPI